MLENFPLEKTVEPLLQWFRENARILPWRESPTPYHVWVSEIMLQQTRVEAVKPYYKEYSADTETEHFGIGLHICRELCRKHGGTLSVANSMRGGAAVTASLQAR